MKLHNILYTTGFICLFAVTPAADRWMQGRTSFITPIIFLVLAGIAWRFGVKEDGGHRKNVRKGG